MRSAIKIILGISIVAGVAYALVGFVASITVLIAPQTISVMLFGLKVSNEQARLIAGIALIFVVVSILSLLVCKYAVEKMDNVTTKKELIPSILLLFVTLSIVSACLLIFTPTDKIVSKHPYFE